MKLYEITLSENLKMSDAGKREWLHVNGKVFGPMVWISSIGKITIHGDLDFGFKHFSSLPFKIDIIEGNLSFGPNKEFKSIDNFPTDVGGLDLSNTGITSLKGLNKMVKRFNREGSGKIHLQNCKITELDMGLIFIENLDGFEYSAGLDKRAETAIAIISKYLDKPEDVFDCQQELIEADLEEFAEYEA